jgi:hypothetical protein
MDITCFALIHCWLLTLCYSTKQCLRNWVRPRGDSLALGMALDLTRSKTQLVLENLLLRQQLIVLQPQVKRPALSWQDRTLLVLIASKLPSWRSALMIVQPDTLLGWHREIFRRVWQRKSKRKGKRGRPPLAADVVALIQSMARDNQTWGAERIRGELLKLGLQVAKSTIQRYLNEVRSPHTYKQTWVTFLRNHAKEIWAADFLQTHDLLLRAVFVFVIIELESRRLVLCWPNSHVRRKIYESARISPHRFIASDGLIAKRMRFSGQDNIRSEIRRLRWVALLSYSG